MFPPHFRAGNAIRHFLLIPLSTALLLAARGEAAAQAQAVTIHEVITPIAFTVINPCPETPEAIIIVEGTIRTVSHTTDDGGGGLHAEVHIRSSGKADAQPTGDQYVYSQEFELSAQMPSNEVTTVTNVITQVLNRTGETQPDDDFLLLARVHNTFHGPAPPIVEVEPELKCR